MENKLPGISCRCITYGRVHTLEETIQSFLQQDYLGEKELIIVNDYGKQTLVYDHPEVKIFNFPEMFETLGDKENFCIQQCKYEIVALMDDDDTYMPNHLSNIAKYFVEGTDLLHWQRGVYMSWPKIEAITQIGNSGIVFSKKIWEQIGGYPKEQAGYDMTFVLKIKSVSKNIVYAQPPDAEVSAFYIWANRSFHCSGMGKDNDNRPNILIRHSEYIEKQRLLGNIPTGIINLNPHWKFDYVKILKQFVSALKITEATYGGKDVTGIVADHIIDDRLSIKVSNVLFGDPTPNVLKYLNVKYSNNGVEGMASIVEGGMCVIPAESPKPVIYSENSPKVKFIVPFPDHPYYLWQVLVQIMNFRKMGYEQDAVYPVSFFRHKPSELLLRMVNSPNIKAKFYLYPAEERVDRSYTAANKPWLMGKYFEQFPEEKGVFNYLDPDVVFTKQMDFEPFIQDDKWYGSSTKSYTGTTYIKSKAEQLLVDLCGIAGVSVEDVEKHDHNSIGAQYFVKNCTADFWFEVAAKSTVGYKHMLDTSTIYKKPEDPYPIQAWASEMYFTQYAMIRHGIEPVASDLMQFSGANHHISDWEKKPYFHNAMVPKENGRDFCKVTYQSSPFRKEIVVSPDSISSKYVELIKETEQEFLELIWD